MYKPAIAAGVITAALAVMLGAFGAHGLKAHVASYELGIFEKGVAYQFYHSFALVAAGILHSGAPRRIVRWASLLFGLGILFFSGSLYLMVALSMAGKSIGAGGIITPVGGLCFIAGWLMLLLGILKKNRPI